MSCLVSGRQEYDSQGFFSTVIIVIITIIIILFIINMIDVQGFCSLLRHRQPPVAGFLLH